MKKKLMALYISNEKKYQEELLKKYNSDDLFKKNIKELKLEVQEDMKEPKIELQEDMKEKWYKKILNMFRK